MLKFWKDTSGATESLRDDDMLKFWEDTSGATAIEYGLIAAFMGAGLITAVSSMGGETSNVFLDIESVLTDSTIAHLKDVALTGLAGIAALATTGERNAAYTDALSQAGSTEELIATAQAIIELSNDSDGDSLLQYTMRVSGHEAEGRSTLMALAQAQYESSPTVVSATYHGYGLTYDAWGGTTDYVQAIEHWSGPLFENNNNVQNHLHDAYIGAGLMDTAEGRAALEHAISTGNTRAQEILDGLGKP